MTTFAWVPNTLKYLSLLRPRASEQNLGSKSTKFTQYARLLWSLIPKRLIRRLGRGHIEHIWIRFWSQQSAVVNFAAPETIEWGGFRGCAAHHAARARELCVTGDLCSVSRWYGAPRRAWAMHRTTPLRDCAYHSAETMQRAVHHECT